MIGCIVVGLYFVDDLVEQLLFFWFVGYVEYGYCVVVIDMELVYVQIGSVVQCICGCIDQCFVLCLVQVELVGEVLYGSVVFCLIVVEVCKFDFVFV